MATTVFRKNACQTTKSKYVRSVLECNVILDRLDQSVIDQIMLNTPDENNQIRTKVCILSNKLNRKNNDFDIYV